MVSDKLKDLSLMLGRIIAAQREFDEKLTEDLDLSLVTELERLRLLDQLMEIRELASVQTSHVIGSSIEILEAE